LGDNSEKYRENSIRSSERCPKAFLKNYLEQVMSSKNDTGITMAQMEN